MGLNSHRPTEESITAYEQRLSEACIKCDFGADGDCKTCLIKVALDQIVERKEELRHGKD